MDPQRLTAGQLTTIGEHLMAAKIYSLAACVMLFYDMALTFGDEVENIWKQRFTGATVLWALNRYLSPLGYIVVIVSWHDPSWSKTTCQRYVLFPEVLKVFTATAVGMGIFRRYHAGTASWFRWVHPNPDLKVINASFSTLITTLMVSRLMLNLRSEVLRRGTVIRNDPSDGLRDNLESVSGPHHLTTMTGTTLAPSQHPSGKATIESIIIGNLGAPVMTFEQVEDEDHQDVYYDDNGPARDERDGVRVEEDIEYGYPLLFLGASSRNAAAVTTAFPTTLRSQPQHFPRLVGNRPNMSCHRASFEGNFEQTRSTPSHLVVQVTEEVTVVSEPPEPPRSRSPRSWLSNIFSPPSPTFRRAMALSTPSASPATSASRLPPELPVIPTTIVSRTHGSGSTVQGLRRSWLPPAFWRLAANRDRESNEFGGFGS
ncbi:hypothetical protein BN946_scf184912.g38 [Trametes cinnabarina]|uniref:DUF6533 domain-containing protein n=1 Tax=Pycnoporus cinnabarinus TaxID=5643 RepID=A0A060SZ40_PYCCI|nr:hypothetical protein BN946_scf184912.g38 [Trametes cinnabarina]